MKPAAAAAGLTLTVVLLATGVAVAPQAVADSNPPPSAGDPTPTAPVRIDPTSPDLQLPEGSTLAPPKVLDIVSVTDQSSVAASQPEQRQETSNSTVTYALQSEVVFTRDSATLSPSATSRIQAIAADINTRHVTSPIRVFGFTDDLGSSEHGAALSKQRAQAVYQVLATALSSAGDSSHTFQVRGYGEDYPIADNSSETGRRQNRRVEITFTPPAA
ncbi:OmpA family protein [Streptomyces cocklensis]|jgi:outer membrane protein OmpA-like peptidoglycan-associated protein|uniref:OmpA family protein n=1 Tax=Actinacidiphila cocklensis TaxID=887465 RepID=A0A9W4DPX8_9ACTN|nr:OmpA family protein [Actinacidiphila cocklensis]MDD1062877.1 OmpA family protein [Actinacidiphila cocklensis]CAG6394138.1 OmpA family protein [Actinacidiphila cocklensis]